MDNSNEHHLLKPITVSLDIGTSKISLMIAKRDLDNDNFTMLGFGIAESEGLNRGVVNNIDKVVKAIKNVVQQAETQSGLKIEDVVVGISGDHIENTIQKTIISISNPNQEVTQSDVNRLIEEAKRTSLSADKCILHTFPLDFNIDGNSDITDPIGMSAIRMESNVLLITASAPAIQNIYKCIERAGLKIKDIVLNPIASGLAVLSDENKEVGVAIVDIGSGTTEIAVYYDKVLKYTSIFGIAGRNITNDIRKELQVSESSAEKIKKEYGNCLLNYSSNDYITLNLNNTGANVTEIPKSQLTSIIQARAIEILGFVKYELEQSGYYDKLGAGVILTGGCSLLNDFNKLAQEILGVYTVIGMPQGLYSGGLFPDASSPEYATGVGLILWDLQNNISKQVIENTSPKKLVFGDEDNNIDDEDNSKFDKITSKSSNSFINGLKRIKDIVENF